MSTEKKALKIRLIYFLYIEHCYPVIVLRRNDNGEVSNRYDYILHQFPASGKERRTVANDAPILEMLYTGRFSLICWTPDNSIAYLYSLNDNSSLAAFQTQCY